MNRIGYIYIITNDVNDKVYIGQTSRSIELRFSEHCFDKRSTSAIHKAIQDIGHSHFKIKELEYCDINILDEREKYWVEYYDSYNNGYNSTPDGHSCCFIEDELSEIDEKSRYYLQVRVVENNIIFDSLQDLSRQFQINSNFKSDFVKDKAKKAIEENKEFFGYHLKREKISKNQVSSIDDIENWIKTLNIKYIGKHVYCPELNKEFDTASDAAYYLLENKYYTGVSWTPMQTLVTSIRKSMKDNSYIESTSPELSFQEVPGKFTKNKGGNFEACKIFSPELNEYFNNQTLAAKAIVKSKVWGNINEKTARDRISDIVRGYFVDYKGISFRAVDENENLIEPPLLKIQYNYYPKNKDKKNDISQEEISEIKNNKKNIEEEIVNKKNIKSKKKQKHGNWNTYKDISDAYLECLNVSQVMRDLKVGKPTIYKACKENNVSIKSHEEWLKETRIPIKQIDINGNVIKEFTCIQAVLKEFNFPDSSFRLAINSGKVYKGYFWKK